MPELQQVFLVPISLLDYYLSNARCSSSHFSATYLSGNNNDISYCYNRQITIYRYKYGTEKEVIAHDQSTEKTFWTSL
jgi:hypothetical protein